MERRAGRRSLAYGCVKVERAMEIDMTVKWMIAGVGSAVRKKKDV